MPERTDVYRNYNYMLELGQGEKAAYFTEVTGLGLSVECIEFREGGNPLSSARKLPGRVKVHPVTLSWGVSSNRDMWELLMGAVNGKVTRKSLSIIILGTDGVTEKVRWNLNEAWVSEWRGAELDALGQQVAIETMTIHAETIERAADVQAPEAAEGGAA